MIELYCNNSLFLIKNYETTKFFFNVWFRSGLIDTDKLILKYE